MKKNIIILFSCIAISCGMNRRSQDISGNSLLRSEGKGNMMIMSKNIILYKTTVYPDVEKYVFDNNFIIIKQKPSRSGMVSPLAFDLYSRYTAHAEYVKNNNIFSEKAWRKLKGKVEWDSLNYKIFAQRFVSLENTSEDMEISRLIADSLIANDPNYKKIFSNRFNYWIIRNSNDSLIGPMDETEYYEMRKNMNLPETLQLD